MVRREGSAGGVDSPARVLPRSSEVGAAGLGLGSLTPLRETRDRARPDGGPGREVLMGTVASGGFSASDVGAARTMQSYRNIDGIELTVQHVSYGQVPVESVLSGEAAAIECTATQDGRHYDRRGWCECGSDDAVFVERWTQVGREFHGWICTGCRRLVQAG